MNDSDQGSRSAQEPAPQGDQGWLTRLIHFSLENKLVVFLVLLIAVGMGIRVAPFDWKTEWLPRQPVPTDAIPDLGENQQIVFTEWMGRSPQDVEDQVTYPLTSALLGVSGVKTIRSFSYFGFSSIYVIFKEGEDFDGSRSRILEKLSSLPGGTLPEGVQPSLGPDATALGQVYWYTLEGRDPQGNVVGGWGLDELRTIQDFQVRYALQSADGVSEVASVGGFVQEYQVDVDPHAMRAHGITLDQVFRAVRAANLDVGARSIEINRVEYFIRGLGFIEEVGDLEKSVVAVNDNVPLYIKDVARVIRGPALRRGALDKGGAEVVGGVVVVRYGANPLSTIQNVKRRIEEIAPGLPEKAVIDWRRTDRAMVRAWAEARGFDAYADSNGEEGFELNQDAWVAWLKKEGQPPPPDWLTLSKVTVVPFYDRTGLIHETLGTLNTAIFQEVLVTILVVLVMVRHLGSSTLISGLLPLSVLLTFIAMAAFGVDANIVALSGIAIAIGTMVDMGIVISENILRRLQEAGGPAVGARRALPVIARATREVGGAVLTAVATTVVGFLPVFAMEGPEGKLFRPLAYTKTFALIASIAVALLVIPPLAHLLFVKRGGDGAGRRRLAGAGWLLAGVVLLVWLPWWVGTGLMVAGGYRLVEPWLPQAVRLRMSQAWIWVLVGVVAVALTRDWLPLGPEKGFWRNLFFVAVLLGGVLLAVQGIMRIYGSMLRLCLRFKGLFLTLPLALVFVGGAIWLGMDRLTAWLPEPVRQSPPLTALSELFPGLGKEFMPPLDEGSYLFMPVTMPHASIGEALDVLQKQDVLIETIPEVGVVVGKLGRVESALDPAPVSMFETVINYHPEYVQEGDGRRRRFRFNPREVDWYRDLEGRPVKAPDGQPYRVRGTYERDEEGRLIPDPGGAPYRRWRPPLDPELNPGRAPWEGIREPDDIWRQIVRVTRIPGTTSATRLQPIAARLVMLQTGMRAPMGVKVKGPDLETIERVGLEIERRLKQVSGVRSDTVLADRIVGKPYLEIDIDREAIARHGLNIRQVQDVIEVAIGGRRITTTVEGRERYPVRVRYLRELRDQIETLGQILVPGMDGAQIPLTQLAAIRYARGPQAIKSEDTFLVGYVIFDKEPGEAEVDVVERCQAHLGEALASGEWRLPAGVSYQFTGNYENQVRATKKLSVLVPLSLLVIFIILYLQFRSTATAMMVFSGVLVGWAGGFLMIWLYGQPWFLDVSVFGTELRELFQIHAINLSVAIWVGFLALFGIATDNGVLVATILDQQFRRQSPENIEAIRRCTVEGALRRVRPALMTSATTVLALLPVLTSTGRGSDIMVPMAIPSFGGMVVALLAILLVPVLYCSREEWRWHRQARRGTQLSNGQPPETH